jgi:hypothetical protein
MEDNPVGLRQDFEGGCSLFEDIRLEWGRKTAKKLTRISENPAKVRTDYVLNTTLYDTATPTYAMSRHNLGKGTSGMKPDISQL